MTVLLRVLLIAVAWVAIHIGSGYIAHHVPFTWLQGDSMLFRTRRFEQEGRLYRRLFRVHRWKDLLPEAGAAFEGGFAKRSLSGADVAYLEQFVAETRRAELTHWLPLLFSLTFFLWNPLEIALWMPLYAILSNIPFIMVQRSNRPRLQAAATRRGQISRQ